MAESLSTYLYRHLKQGYKIQRFKGPNKGVIDPEGNFLTDDGTLILFQDNLNPNRASFRANLMAALRRAGAIRDPVQRSSEPRQAKKVSYQEPKNALIIAQETLRDPQATSRERALAKNYIAVSAANTTLNELAHRLALRIRELEESVTW